MATRPSLGAGALALSLGPAVGIGLARFGCAVLLPAMRTDPGWRYTQAGNVNTTNSFGYLAGALVAVPLPPAWGVGPSFSAAILMTGVGMSLSGTTSSFALLLVLRTVAGVAGAGAPVILDAAPGMWVDRAPARGGNTQHRTPQ